MGDVVGQILPIAVAIAVSPLPIVAVVLLLGAPRARVTGPVYVAAFVAGTAAVGAIVIAAIGDEAEDGAGGTPGWVSGLRLALGILLLVLAVGQWRGRPRDGAGAELPAWMRRIDGFGASRAAGAGIAMSALNPKNLVLVIAAATVIAQAGLTAGEEAGALAVLVGIGALGVAVPVVLYLALGDRSAGILGATKEWMARNNSVIMAVILLILGVTLVGDAISGFAG